MAAGATRTLWTGLVTTHMQGSCRMGSDPARSVVDANAEAHTVRRLFVGDGSVIPRTLSANPSLTIMALALRLADHLRRGPERLPRVAARTGPPPGSRLRATPQAEPARRLKLRTAGRASTARRSTSVIAPAPYNVADTPTATAIGPLAARPTGWSASEPR